MTMSNSPDVSLAPVREDRDGDLTIQNGDGSPVDRATQMFGRDYEDEERAERDLDLHLVQEHTDEDTQGEFSDVGTLNSSNWDTDDDDETAEYVPSLATYIHLTENHCRAPIKNLREKDTNTIWTCVACGALSTECKYKRHVPVRKEGVGRQPVGWYQPVRARKNNKDLVHGQADNGTYLSPPEYDARMVAHQQELADYVANRWPDTGTSSHASKAPPVVETVMDNSGEDTLDGLGELPDVTQRPFKTAYQTPAPTREQKLGPSWAEPLRRKEMNASLGEQGPTPLCRNPRAPSSNSDFNATLQGDLLEDSSSGSPYLGLEHPDNGQRIVTREASVAQILMRTGFLLNRRFGNQQEGLAWSQGKWKTEDPGPIQSTKGQPIKVSSRPTRKAPRPAPILPPTGTHEEAKTTSTIQSSGGLSTNHQTALHGYERLPGERFILSSLADATTLVMNGFSCTRVLPTRRKLRHGNNMA